MDVYEPGTRDQVTTLSINQNFEPNLILVWYNASFHLKTNMQYNFRIWFLSTKSVATSNRLWPSWNIIFGWILQSTQITTNLPG